MKTLTSTLAILTLVLSTLVAQAQTSTVKIYLTENSNNPAQAHSPIVIGFDPNGDNALSYPDAGNASTIGNYNTEMYPFTLTSDGFELTSYDCRPALTTHVTVPFGVLTKDTGDVKIYVVLTSSSPAVATPGYAWIENILTGEHFNLLDTVKLDVSENINFAANYLIHIGLPVSNTVTDETCYEAYDGGLYVQANTPGFTHELTLNGTPLYNSIVTGTDTLVTGLAAGNYVSVVRINGIPVDSSDITIAGGTPLIADFYADYNSIVEGDTVTFFDVTTNAYNYSWHFGDGDSTNMGGDVIHQYNTPGIYMATLTISDENGCTASNYDYIDVASSSTASGNGSGHGHGPMGEVGNGNPNLGNALESFRNTTRFTVSNSRLMVDLSEATSSTVTIVSVNGTVVANERQNDSVATYELPAPGAYIVTVVYANGTANSTTIIAQ